jgi:dehydratase
MKPLARLFQHGSARLTFTAAAGLTAVLGTAAALSAPAASASVSVVTSTITVTFNVKATASGLSGTDSLPETLTAAAPATVKPDARFIVSLSSGAISIPTSADGVTIVDIKSLSLKVKVPANSSYVSCSFSGGSGIGTGTPKCSETNGAVTFKVPGPMDGGTTVTLPKMSVHLKAGTSGTITSKLGGTSYTNPGLKGSADLTVLGSAVTATAVAYPDPNPVLTTTKIS